MFLCSLYIFLPVFRGDFRRLGRNADISTGEDFLQSQLPQLLQQRKEELQAQRAAQSHPEQSSSTPNIDVPPSSSTPPSTSASSSDADLDFPYIVPTLKVKPFMYTYQREIVLYCHYRKLNFFSVECTYASSAFRGFSREFLVKLAGWYPQSIMSLKPPNSFFHSILYLLYLSTDVLHSASLISISDTQPPQRMRFCKICGFISSNDICQSCALIQELKDMEASAHTGCFISKDQEGEQTDKGLLPRERDVEELV